MSSSKTTLDWACLAPIFPPYPLMSQNVEKCGKQMLGGNGIVIKTLLLFSLICLYTECRKHILNPYRRK